MMPQSNAGADARDDAIARVDQAADPYWKQCAALALEYVAQRRDLFTTDAIWHVLAHYYPDASTHEPRAMGAVMLGAKRAGLIESTDRFVPSLRGVNHRQPTRVWRSLIKRDLTAK